MSWWHRAEQSFLPDRDYLPVAMPTTDLHVLRVLVRNGGALRQYSELSTVLVGDGAADPTVERDATVVNAQGKSTRTTKVGLGLSAAGALVKALGGAGSLDLKAEKTHTVEYGYTDVTADRVDLATLDKWLANADFDPDSRTTADLLAADGLFVVVGALKARGVTVTLLDASDHGIDLDLDEIRNTVGAEVKVSSAGERTGTVTFQGSTPLVVAVKAAQIQLTPAGFGLNPKLADGGEIRTLGGATATYLAGGELRLS
jgi:hypothetical protein